MIYMPCPPVVLLAAVGCTEVVNTVHWNPIILADNLSATSEVAR